MEFVIDNIDKTRDFDVRNKTWEFISNMLYVSQERYMHLYAYLEKKITIPCINGLQNS